MRNLVKIYSNNMGSVKKSSFKRIIQMKIFLLLLFRLLLPKAKYKELVRFNFPIELDKARKDFTIILNPLKT